MRDAFSDALVAAAESDPKVLLLTGDHGYALFDAFRKACPQQYINCGIAEQNMVGVAAGLAKAGFKPVVYGLAAFVPVRVLEQIKIDVCYESLPVVLIGDGAGVVYSHLGTSHQSTEDIACVRAIPGLTVLSPADRHEMKAAMETALRLSAPVYMRMGKSDRGDVHTGPVQMPMESMLQLRKGSGRTVFLATGSMVRTAIDAAEHCTDIDVWSVPCIKPLSSALLMEIAAGAERIVSFEEHSVIGGLGASIAEQLAEQGRVPLLRIGVGDRFSHHCGTWDYLIKEHGLGVEQIVPRIASFLNQSP